MDLQLAFERELVKIFEFDSFLQREKGRENMILHELDNGVGHLNELSGTTAFKMNEIGRQDFLLIATYDSEKNYISCITEKMLELIVKYYCFKANGQPTNKVQFATNILLETTNDHIETLKKDHNLHIYFVGEEFCKRKGLTYTPMY